MPQLDQFIFLNQIVSLTLFFFLIYIYVRGTIIPSFSSVLKFRRKKVNRINKNIFLFSAAIYNTKHFAKGKSLKYLNTLFSSFNDMMVFHNKENLNNMVSLYNNYKNVTSLNNLFSLKKANYGMVRVLVF